MGRQHSARPAPSKASKRGVERLWDARRPLERTPRSTGGAASFHDMKITFTRAARRVGFALLT